MAWMIMCLVVKIVTGWFAWLNCEYKVGINVEKDKMGQEPQQKMSTIPLKYSCVKWFIFIFQQNNWVGMGRGNECSGELRKVIVEAVCGVYRVHYTVDSFCI